MLYSERIIFTAWLSIAAECAKMQSVKADISNITRV